MKLIITPTGIFKVLFLLANLICVLNVFQLQAAVSLSYTFVFPLVVLLFVMTFPEGKRKNDVILLLIIVVSALSSVCISLLLAETSVGITDLKKFIIFVITLAFFFSANRMKIDQKTISFIEISITIVSVILILLYFWKSDELYVQNLLGMRFLTFHFDNPNFAAMYLFVYAMFNSILAEKQKKLILKLLHLILALFMFYFVFRTLSRNVLLTGALFFIAFVVFKFFKKIQLTYNLTLSAIVAAWPILFVVAYKLLIGIISNIGFLSFLTESGKELDTRNDVWSTAFSEITKYPLTGNYGASIIRQSHNTHLDIWVSYGIIALVCTIILIAYIIHNNGRAYANRISYLYMFGFVCCIVMGMAEAALFAGCQGLFILIGAFILLSKTDGEVNLKRL